MIDDMETGREEYNTGDMDAIQSKLLTQSFSHMEHAPKIDAKYPAWGICAIIVYSRFINFRLMVEAVKTNIKCDITRIEYLATLSRITPFDINTADHKRIKSMHNYLLSSAECLLVDPFDYTDYLAKYTPPVFPGYKLRELSKIAIPEGSLIVYKEEALARIDEMLSKYVPPNFDWSNIVLAGGSVAKLIMPAQSKFLNNRSDIDFFIYGEDLKSSVDAFKRILGLFDNYKKSINNSVCTVYDFNAPKMIQLISINRKTAAEVIKRFDLSNCQWMYNGSQILCTPLAVKSLREMTCYVSGETNTSARFAKAHANGYDVSKTLQYLNGAPFVYDVSEIKTAYSQYLLNTFSPPMDLIESEEDMATWLENYISTQCVTGTTIAKDKNFIMSRYEHSGKFSSYYKNSVEMSIDDVLENFAEIDIYRTSYYPLKTKRGRINVILDNIEVSEIEHYAQLNIDITVLGEKVRRLCNLLRDSNNPSKGRYEMNRYLHTKRDDYNAVSYNLNGSLMNLKLVRGEYSISLVFNRLSCKIGRIFCTDDDEPQAIIKLKNEWKNEDDDDTAEDLDNYFASIFIN